MCVNCVTREVFAVDLKNPIFVLDPARCFVSAHIMVQEADFLLSQISL